MNIGTSSDLKCRKLMIEETRTMYQKIKVALGPQVNKVAPIESKSGERQEPATGPLDRTIF